jgi:glycosyltransferase involved in cell wall biosynthesis
VTKIDILLPTYKPKEHYLHQSLDTIMAQEFTDWTLHINDQVSDIDTETMVTKYTEDPRVHFHKNHDHPGIGANWNACLQYVKAPIVQYMFDDDVWEPHYLQAVHDTFEANPEVGIASFEHEYLYEDQQMDTEVYERLLGFMKQHFQEGVREGRELLLWWLEQGLHPNIVGEPMFVALRKETIDTVGRFREDMFQNLDSEYWARCLLATDWYYKEGKFGKFRVHPEQTSAQNAKAGKGILDRKRSIETIVKMIDGPERKLAQQISKNQTAQMMAKFVSRYGNKEIVVSKTDTPLSLSLHHPITVGLCVVKYIWKHKITKSS